MTKRILSLVLVWLTAVLSVRFVGAASGFQLNALASCRRVFAYSGNASAYFFGWSGNTLVSSRVIPDEMTRTVGVQGSIVCACHNDDCACALYQAGVDAYMIVMMHMDSGSCENREVARGRAVQQTSVAVADGEVFVIVVDRGMSYVLGCRADSERSYRFSGNVDRLFVSGNCAYARLDGGRVYRLGGGDPVLCEGVAENPTAFSSDGEMSAFADGREAVLRRDFSCTVKDHAAEGQEPRGDILTVETGISVSRFKKDCGDVGAVLDHSGAEVTGGAMKTGYLAQLRGKTLPVAVLGDLDGSGTISSRDTAVLMRFFAGGEVMDACASRAADFNGDSAVDNRDLLLIARAAG